MPEESLDRCRLGTFPRSRRPVLVEVVGPRTSRIAALAHCIGAGVTLFVGMNLRREETEDSPRWNGRRVVQSVHLDPVIAESSGKKEPAADLVRSSGRVLMLSDRRGNGAETRRSRNSIG